MPKKLSRKYLIKNRSLINCWANYRVENPLKAICDLWLQEVPQFSAVWSARLLQKSTTFMKNLNSIGLRKNNFEENLKFRKMPYNRRYRGLYYHSSPPKGKWKSRENLSKRNLSTKKRKLFRKFYKRKLKFFTLRVNKNAWKMEKSCKNVDFSWKLNR